MKPVLQERVRERHGNGMNDKGTKRREWVKTAAIVFLSILLVLTFFSNTIMNYSLPEVAAQYAQSGTITAKIRGTGVVESGDPYNIQINESRTVESVMVKSGDVVQKGDVLFRLADKESTELTAKEKELEDAVLAFETAILSGEISNSVINNVQNGTTSTLEGYQARILNAEKAIENQKAQVADWQTKVDEIQVKIDQLDAEIERQGYSTADTSAEEREVYNAQKAYDDKNTELTQAQNQLEALKTELNTATSTIQKVENGLITVTDGDAASDSTMVNESDYAYLRLQAEKLPGMITTAQAQVNSLNTELYNLSVNLNNAKANLEAKKSNSGSISSLNVQKTNWNLELKDKTAKLEASKKAQEEAETAKAQLITDIGKELSLDAQVDAIGELQEEVEKLKEQAVGAVIEAPISGTISSVSITAGQDTAPGTPIATMQPEGKGYTMSFSVTNDQAKRLSVGTTGTLVNAWRYDDVSVTLASIKPDPSEPSQKKLLTFDVTGSVVPGQTLNVSVGDKSANYDIIVPNSAIREDNNGKFILIVESKSSPLGNRYIATRVDIEVLASDDTQSAISGGLYGYEFVITTSTKPVEAGKQVRLADN